MRLFILFTFLVCSLNIYGQNNPVNSSDSSTISKEQLSQTIQMLKDLSTKGIDLSKDSLYVSEEFNRLLTNEDYFKSIYPEIYSWEQTIIFIETKELKKAFWFLINLYPTSDENKELVIKSVISYDALFKMDLVLINTFYTYAFTDPEISKIIDNKPEIIRPDILENKLRVVKEITQYLYMYREQTARQEQLKL
jgi:hypothetical protein